VLTIQLRCNVPPRVPENHLCRNESIVSASQFSTPHFNQVITNAILFFRHFSLESYYTAKKIQGS
jgi:hypothetical protein